MARGVIIEDPFKEDKVPKGKNEKKDVVREKLVPQSAKNESDTKRNKVSSILGNKLNALNGVQAVPEVDYEELGKHPLEVVAKTLSLREEDFKNNPEMHRALLDASQNIHDRLVTGDLVGVTPREKHIAVMQFYSDMLSMYVTERPNERTPQLSALQEINQEDRMRLVNEATLALSGVGSALSNIVKSVTGKDDPALQKEVESWARPLRYEELQNPESVQNLFIGALKRARIELGTKISDKENFTVLSLLNGLIDEQSSMRREGNKLTVEATVNTLKVCESKIKRQAIFTRGEVYAHRLLTLRKEWLPKEVYEQLQRDSVDALSAFASNIGEGEVDEKSFMWPLYQRSVASEATQQYVGQLPDGPPLTKIEIKQLRNDATNVVATLDAALHILSLYTGNDDTLKELKSWYKPMGKDANASAPMLTNMAITAVRRVQTMLVTTGVDNTDTRALRQSLADILSRYTPNAIPADAQSAHVLLAAIADTFAEIPKDINARKARAEMGSIYVNNILKVRAPWLPTELQNNLKQYSELVKTRVQFEDEQNSLMLRNFHRAALGMEASGIPFDKSLIARLGNVPLVKKEIFDQAQNATRAFCKKLKETILSAHAGESGNLFLAEINDWEEHFDNPENATPEAQINMAVIIARRLGAQMEVSPDAKQYGSAITLSNSLINLYSQTGVDGVRKDFEGQELQRFALSVSTLVNAS